MQRGRRKKDAKRDYLHLQESLTACTTEATNTTFRRERKRNKDRSGNESKGASAYTMTFKTATEDKKHRLLVEEKEVLTVVVFFFFLRK